METLTLREKFTDPGISDKAKREKKENIDWIDMKNATYLWGNLIQDSDIYRSPHWMLGNSTWISIRHPLYIVRWSQNPWFLLLQNCSNPKSSPLNWKHHYLHSGANPKPKSYPGVFPSWPPSAPASASLLGFTSKICQPLLSPLLVQATIISGLVIIITSCQFSFTSIHLASLQPFFF